MKIHFILDIENHARLIAVGTHADIDLFIGGGEVKYIQINGNEFLNLEDDSFKGLCTTIGYKTDIKAVPLDEIIRQANEQLGEILEEAEREANEEAQGQAALRRDYLSNLL